MFMRLSTLTSVVLALTASWSSSRAMQTVECDDILRDPSATYTGWCSSQWSLLQPNVRPTQFDLGYAWVQHKLDDDFGSLSDAEDDLEDSIPAVLGPNDKFYVTDSHHTLAALDLSGYDVLVTLNVICDWREYDLETFWQKVRLRLRWDRKGQGLGLGFAPGTEICCSEYFAQLQHR